MLGVPLLHHGARRGPRPRRQPPLHDGGWVLEATAGERARMWWKRIERWPRCTAPTGARSTSAGWCRRAPPRARPPSSTTTAGSWTGPPRVGRNRRRGGVEVAGGQPAGREAATSRSAGAMPGSATSSGRTLMPLRSSTGRCNPRPTRARSRLWLLFDRQFTEGLGVERPSGFPSHEATVERYASCSGRDFGDLFWYQSSAGSASLSSCAASRTCWSARACCRASRTWDQQPRHQFLAQLLDLPSPAEAAESGQDHVGRPSSSGSVRRVTATPASRRRSAEHSALLGCSMASSHPPSTDSTLSRPSMWRPRPPSCCRTWPCRRWRTWMPPNGRPTRAGRLAHDVGAHRCPRSS